MNQNSDRAGTRCLCSTLVIMGLFFVFASSCKKDLDLKVPTLFTFEITEITQTAALSGGNIIDDGGASIMAKGVCWGTAENPTISDSKTHDGEGTGDFTSNISGLETNTTYYIRAYATISAGTGYGDQKSFTTYMEDAITDIDGNYYNIVTIGNQEWLTENLRTTRYNDGSSIPTVHNYEEWGNIDTGAYVFHSHDEIDGLNSEAEVIQAYGVLYNWNAVETGKLCPAGWHVPSYTEWTTLTNNAGGESIAGGKLKSTRTIPDPHPRWHGPNAGATDEYGFSALPGGWLSEYGLFTPVGIEGDWWTATVDGSGEPGYWRIHWGYAEVWPGHYNRKIGRSVRCLRVVKNTI